MAVRTRPPGLIETGEAVRRALNSEHYTGAKNADAARSWLRRLAREADKPGLVAHGDNGRLWIHPALHPALSELTHKERSAAKVKDLPAHERNKIAAKLQVLRDLEGFRRLHRLGKVDGRRRFAAERGEFYIYQGKGRKRVLKFTACTLGRWAKAYEDGGADALADDGRGRWNRQQVSEEAAALYWTLRAGTHKNSIAYCWRVVANRAEEAGWRWFNKLDTCLKWDRRTRDERALILCREGDEAFTRKADSYIELEPESFAPGQCSVGDDHTCDLWVECGSGDYVRPVLSLWQDWRTRAIYGYRLIREGNEHSLLLALGDGVDRFGYLPEYHIADNGKNFKSMIWRGEKPQWRTVRRGPEVKEQVDGILSLCGIQPSWCIPENPNGKAREERWFGTFEDQLVRNFPSYCGNCADNRPESHKDLVAKAVPWEIFAAKVDEYIQIYNNRPHSAEDMHGLSPLQMMSQATRRRVLPDELRPFLLAAWHKPVELGRNGVSIKICAHTMRFGADHPALLALAIGTKVRVSYDPQDLAMIQVWTLDYKHICQAQLNRRLNRSITTEELRLALRAKRSRRSAIRKAYEVGTDYLRDPVEEAVASLRRDSDRRRLPDPPGPSGSPVLVPVMTPLQVPERAEFRKAVGAEGLDARQRMEAFLSKPPSPTRSNSAAELLRQWSQREASQ